MRKGSEWMKIISGTQKNMSIWKKPKKKCNWVNRTVSFSLTRSQSESQFWISSNSKWNQTNVNKFTLFLNAKMSSSWNFVIFLRKLWSWKSQLRNLRLSQCSLGNWRCTETSLWKISLLFRFQISKWLFKTLNWSL